MPAPRKKDYTEVSPAVIEAYKKIRNVTKVARLFSISPYTVKHILDNADIQTGPAGTTNHHWKKAPLPQKCCAKCHKYSRTTTISGWCFTHRRCVAGRNIEPCFV